MGKKTFNPEAIADRFFLVAMIMPEFEFTQNKGTGNFYMEMYKKDDPDYRVRFWVQEYGYDGKVEGRLMYPEGDSKRENPYIESDKKHSISFSVEKDPSKIAADIRKRLLIPEYDGWLAQVKERIAQSRAFYAKEDAFKEELVQLGYADNFNGERAYFSKELKHIDNTGQFRVSGDKVQFEMRYIEREKALKIIEFMKGL